MDEQPTRVLLVAADENDSSLTREMLRQIYSEHFTLDWVRRRSEALGAIASRHFDVILVDDRLGAEDGLELIRDANTGGCAVPFILLTSQDDRQIDRAAREAGATDSLVKGRYTAETLERTLRFAICQKQTEAALRLSETRYRLLFESVPQPMFIYDVDTLEFLDVNWAVVRLYGYTREELLGMTVADIRPPEEVPRLLQWIQEYRDRPHVDAGLWRHRKKDGTILDVEIASSLLTSLNRPARIALVQDVTERQRAEAAMRESERFARGVLDSLSANIAVLDGVGRILAVNRSWRATAAEAGALCGGYTFEGADYLAVCAAADTDFAAGLRDVLAGRREIYVQEYPCHLPDKRRWFLGRVTPFLGEGPPQVVVSHIDVTERKLAEEALERYVERLEHLRRLDQTILASRRPAELAAMALNHLRTHIAAWHTSLYLIDVRRRRFRVLATAGAAQAHPKTGSFAPLDDLGDDDLVTLQAGAIHAVEDVATLPRPSAVVAVLAAEGMQSYVRIPLRVQGKLIGALNLCFDRPERLAGEPLEIAIEIANQLAIAIRGAQLFSQVRRGRRRLATLSRRLIDTQEAERRHLARELHDEIGQLLTALKLGLQAAFVAPPEARAALDTEGTQIIDRLIGQVRDLSVDLRPSMLDDLGLLPALRWYVDRFARRCGIEATLAVDTPDARVPPAVETACFRIAQEALTNIARHAHATTARIELQVLADELSLIIRDDGQGFDLQAAREQAGRGAGLGLLGMRERAALLGGRLEIETAPGQGCTTRLTIPLTLS